MDTAPLSSVADLQAWAKPIAYSKEKRILLLYYAKHGEFTREQCRDILQSKLGELRPSVGAIQKFLNSEYGDVNGDEAVFSRILALWGEEDRNGLRDLLRPNAEIKSMLEQRRNEGKPAEQEEDGDPLPRLVMSRDVRFISS